MLKILLFSPKGAGPHYFGPGMSAFRMYKSLDKNSVSVSLAHGFKNQEDIDVFDHQYFISEIKKKNILSGIHFLRKAKKWIQENAHKFDVVHCLSAFQIPFMVAYWFEQAGVPVIIKITGSKYIGFNDSSLFSKFLGLKRFRQQNANHITGYISISKEISRKLIESGIESEKIHLIPNGVNTERFQPIEGIKKKELREKLGLANKKTCIFTGSFDDNKNPYLIAKAFQSLSDRNNIQLLLIGPDRDGGIQRNLIKELISNKRLKNIIVRDFISNIDEYYQASDLFVLPSKHEGLSNSMLEALSCGLPAVVTRISGAEDLIDESINGTFVEHSSESLAEVISEYFSDKDKLVAHSAGARKTILESYSSEKILQKHLTLFEKIKRSN